MPSEQGRAENLRTIANQKMAELNETIELRRVGSAKAALGIVETDLGKKQMDRIREICAAVIADQNAALDLEQRVVQDHATRAQLIVADASAVMFVFLCLAAFALRRTERDGDRFVDALHHSMQRTREARDLLAITLSSIGDGVIATDSRGPYKLHESCVLRAHWMGGRRSSGQGS